MNVPIKNSSPKKPKKEKAKGNIETRGTTKHKLPVVINEAAVQKKEARIRAALTEKVLEAEKMRPHQLKIKGLSEEIEKLRKEAESYTEERDVKCEVLYDFAHREIRYKRLDTGKIVDSLSKTMTDEDRTPDLFHKGKKLGTPVLTPGEAMAAARAEDKPAAEPEAPVVDAEDDPDGEHLQ